MTTTTSPAPGTDAAPSPVKLRQLGPLARPLRPGPVIDARRGSAASRLRPVAVATTLLWIAPAAAGAEPAGIRSPSPTERYEAVVAMGWAADPADVPALAGVVRWDSHRRVRGWALRALYRIHTHDAWRVAVVAARTDPDPEVRRLAADLAGIEPEPAPPPPAVTPPPPRPRAVPPPPPEVEARAPAPPLREGEPGRGLLIAGGWTLGAGYVASLFVGAITLSVPFGWASFVPVVGPAVFSISLMIEEPDSAALAWMPLLMTVGQTVGAVLLGVGLWRRSHRRAGLADRARSPSLAVVPMTSRSCQGIGLIGVF